MEHLAKRFASSVRSIVNESDFVDPVTGDVLFQAVKGRFSFRPSAATVVGPFALGASGFVMLYEIVGRTSRVIYVRRFINNQEDWFKFVGAR